MARQGMGLVAGAIASVALLVGGLTGGCASDFSTFGDGATTTATTGSGGNGTGVTTGTGANTGSGGNGGTGTGTGASGGTGGGGGSSAQCAAPGDCDMKLGPAPCGNWACNMGSCQISAAGCTDADHDGYGSGPNCMCAGLDCDDSNAQVHDNATATCYGGPANTSGHGVCHDGNKSCTGGVWTPCIGEVDPSGEACNNLDDDCNDKVDDNLGSFSCGIGECANSVAACLAGKVQLCVPKSPPSAVDGPPNFCNGKDDNCDGVIDEGCKACVPVSGQFGDDAKADGTFNNGIPPFKTIQAAITAAANNANLPKLVCVAGPPACQGTLAYQLQNGQTITMSDGVSVVGSYDPNTWQQCAGQLNITTVIQPGTVEGVTFNSKVQKLTVLDGFRIDRMGTNGTTSGITVDGAKNAIISGVQIINTVGATNSYGVNIINGGDVTVTRSRIDGGTGGVESIGVRSVGSKLNAVNNCQGLDGNGRCDDFCGTNPSLRGRTQQGGTNSVSYAVLLDGSPGSKVETSSMCGNLADIAALVRIKGDGANITVRANYMFGFSGVVQSHGVWAEDCNAAKPWIVDNYQIQANGSNANSSTDGVRAIGDCHPVIDSNVAIGGGGEGNAANPNGVHCGPNAANVPSKCVVLGNKRIAGSVAGFPPIATGVRCDGASCARIEQNAITGRGGNVSYGVYLQQSGAYVDNNDIRGGCSTVATGVMAVDSYSRLQNNRIIGYTNLDCNGAVFNNVQLSYGLRTTLAAGNNELDVHSNDIDGGGSGSNNVNCQSRGIQLDAGPVGPKAASGIYRNNIIRAGLCTTLRVGVHETVNTVDPRIFEHNDLDPFANPNAIYIDENVTQLTLAAQVDALKDMTVNGTLSVDAGYVNYPSDLHITASSQCNNKGTPTGEPAKDMDGQARDKNTPDIGADEQ